MTVANCGEKVETIGRIEFSKEGGVGRFCEGRFVSIKVRLIDDVLEYVVWTEV